MKCLRCEHEMMRTHHDERESVIPGVSLVTRIILNECPTCCTMVKIILPIYPEQRVA